MRSDHPLDTGMPDVTTTSATRETSAFWALQSRSNHRNIVLLCSPMSHEKCFPEFGTNTSGPAGYRRGVAVQQRQIGTIRGHVFTARMQHAVLNGIHKLDHYKSLRGNTTWVWIPLDVGGNAECPALLARSLTPWLSEARLDRAGASVVCRNWGNSGILISCIMNVSPRNGRPPGRTCGNGLSYTYDVSWQGIPDRLLSRDSVTMEAGLWIVQTRAAPTASGAPK